MKLKLTAIAAAVTLAASFSVAAEARDPIDSANSNANSGTAGAFSAQETQRQSMDGYGLSDYPEARHSIIHQQGSGNFAETQQYGADAQFSDVFQSGTGNESRVLQDNTYGGENESIVKQLGSENKADVTQTGNRDDSWVVQDGTNNNALVRQINSTDRSDSMIQQYGNDNEADILQQNVADETWSFLYQQGDRNIAEVHQENISLSASYIFQKGDDHRAEVFQSGDTHVSMVRQLGVASGVAQHIQTGSGNEALTTQW